MNALALKGLNVSRGRTWLLLLGVILVMGSWVLLYGAESLFTESHLVGYYCCVSAQDLPAVGTLSRTLSDFFRTFPGKHLPSLALVAINAGILIGTLRQARRKAWLPFLFVLLSLLYLAVSFLLVAASWSLSGWIMGPVTSAYKGYDRTWYGIVLHFAWWAIFVFALARLRLWAVEKER